MRRRRSRAGTLAVAGAVAVLLASAPSRAASGRAILLESHLASAGARRGLTLIHDELAARGLDVASVDVGPNSDPVSMAEVMRRQEGAVATIALLGNPESG